jgi:regulator of RNase E activity RraB
MADTNIQESIAGHASRNAALLEDLRRRGVDVGRPHSVEHHFWAGNQKSAALLAKRLYELGYLILVISPADEDGSKVWNVEAGIQRTLADAGSERVTEELVRLAAQFDAIYDGWGASV